MTVYQEDETRALRAEIERLNAEIDRLRRELVDSASLLEEAERKIWQAVAR